MVDELIVKYEHGESLSNEEVGVLISKLKENDRLFKELGGWIGVNEIGRATDLICGILDVDWDELEKL